MTKKAIPFQNPSKATLARTASDLASSNSQTELGVDQWVHRPDQITETAQAPPIRSEQAREVLTSVMVSIPAEPDPCEIIKIWFLLPHLTFWFWTFGAMQRNLLFFVR